MVAKAGSHLLAATAFAVLAGAAVSAGSARAQDATCLAAPHGPAPAGTHWYYKTDQGTHQKCWYTRAATAPPVQTAPSRAVSEQGDAANPDADGAAAPEESAAPVALAPTVAPPVPERAAPPASAAPRRATSPIARIPVPAADPRGEHQPITTAATAMPAPTAAPGAQATSLGPTRRPCRRPPVSRGPRSPRRPIGVRKPPYPAPRPRHRHQARTIRLPRRVQPQVQRTKRRLPRNLTTTPPARKPTPTSQPPRIRQAEYLCCWLSAG